MEELKGILCYTYQKRISLNPQYSQNAFARDLQVSPTALSQFLSGKRNLSKKNLSRVTKALTLPENYSDQSQTTKIKMEEFSLISEWYHFGILNLVEVDEVRTIGQISSRLGIPMDVAQIATERLISLGFLKLQDGLFSRVQKSLDAGNEIPSEAFRKHNREKMELAIGSLERSALHERDVSSLTVTFDPNLMDQVKHEIQKFKTKVNKICKHGRASEVYSLNVQFFSLSRKEEVK